MTYLAVGELAVLVLTVLAFTNLLRGQQRAHARREDLLVNQLLHAAGKTWQPSPESEAWRKRQEEAQDDRREYEVRFTASPEQLPVPN